MLTDWYQKSRAARKLERLRREAEQIRKWLADNPDERRGAKGALRLSNRTDNESAKVATGKGVVQGYTGVSAVDEVSQSEANLAALAERLPLPTTPGCCSRT